MDADPLLGQLIPPYRIERLIGSGGMGLVYEARHERHDHRAAAKVMHADRSLQAEDRNRFLQEARVLSRLDHEGLVKIIDSGELPDGRLFILMEYLDGETLAARLHRQAGHRLDWVTALHFTHQIASTIAAVHHSGIVHRDLKPSNIVLVVDPATPLGERAKVVDFGIAKFLPTVGVSATLTKGFIGTPRYMAPERATAGAVVDAKSDVYSLGCLLYEFLCGRPLFGSTEDPGSQSEQETELLATLISHLKDTPIPPRHYVLDLPPAVDSLVLRMLAKGAAQRPSMVEVADEIKQLLSDPQYRRAANWRARLRRFTAADRRSRGMRLAVVGIMFLIVALTVLWFLRGLWSHVPPPAPSPALLRQMVRIAGGQFAMGSDDIARLAARGLAHRLGYDAEYELGAAVDLFQREQPVRRITLSTFEIDRTEVTNQQFVEFLNGLAPQQVEVRHVKNSPGDQSDWTFYKGVLIYNLFPDISYNGIQYDVSTKRFTARRGMEDSPVSAVSWDGASLYCQHQNKRLPTEAEWEFTARNRGQTRFPWGDNEPTCAHAVMERGGRYSHCAHLRPALPAVASTPPDVTMLGVYDLGGGVSEWVADYFRNSYPASGAAQNPQVTTPGDDDNEQLRHVIRGGAWSMDFVSARATGRIRAQHDRTDADTGFRCARSVPAGARDADPAK